MASSEQWWWVEHIEELESKDKFQKCTAGPKPPIVDARQDEEPLVTSHQPWFAALDVTNSGVNGIGGGDEGGGGGDEGGSGGFGSDDWGGSDGFDGGHWSRWWLSSQFLPW